MCAYGRTLSEPLLSPDGAHVAFVAASGGRAQIVLVPAEGGPESVLTNAPAVRSAPSYGGGAFAFTPDGDAIVYAAVDGELWRAPVAGGPAVRLTFTSSVGPAAAPAVAPDGTRVAYVIDQRHVAVASATPDGPWPVRLSAAADFAFDPVWSPDGVWVAWHEWDVPNMPWDASRIVARPADGSGEPVTLVDEKSQVQQPRYAPDGEALAYLSDVSGWLNLWLADREGHRRPVVAEGFEHGSPSWGLGQRSFAWSDDGRRLAFCRNEEGFGRLCAVDLDSGVVQDIARGVHGSLSWRGDRLCALRSGARTPTQIVVYDLAVQHRAIVARGPVAGFEAADLAEPEAVSWQSADGAVVHGRLYRKDRSGPAPTIVWIHGGPTSQWQVSFSPRIAYFVERGWCVLVPDHRGSSGFGRDYLLAMHGGWGVVDVADVAAGIDAAVVSGWADPDRVVVMGGSAGGFTVLHVLAAHGELVAAGVDLYGVADLLHLDETTHRFERHYLHTIVGPLPDTVERYRERSPVNLADRIRTPLLILQGSADEVVPPAQSAAIAEAVRRNGGTVEHHVYDGEGHGWGRPDTVIDELNRVEDFLRRHVLRWRASTSVGER